MTLFQNYFLVFICPDLAVIFDLKNIHRSFLWNESTPKIKYEKMQQMRKAASMGEKLKTFDIF